MPRRDRNADLDFTIHEDPPAPMAEGCEVQDFADKLSEAGEPAIDNGDDTLASGVPEDDHDNVPNDATDSSLTKASTLVEDDGEEAADEQDKEPVEDAKEADAAAEPTVDSMLDELEAEKQMEQPEDAAEDTDVVHEADTETSPATESPEDAEPPTDTEAPAATSEATEELPVPSEDYDEDADAPEPQEEPAASLEADEEDETEAPASAISSEEQEDDAESAADEDATQDDQPEAALSRPGSAMSATTHDDDEALKHPQEPDTPSADPSAEQEEEDEEQAAASTPRCESAMSAGHESDAAESADESVLHHDVDDEADETSFVESNADDEPRMAEDEASAIDESSMVDEDAETQESASRRESAVSDATHEESHRRASGRTEALIHAAAKDIVEQLNQDRKRSSGPDDSIAEEEEHVSESKQSSARPSDAHESLREGTATPVNEEQAHVEQDDAVASAEEGADNSSHNGTDDVFSDHSPRSSVGSVSESEQHHKSIHDNVTQRSRSRSPRISDFSHFNEDDEDFVPTVRGTPRPPFRSPSSVKAMQMSSPTPSVMGSPRSSRRTPLPTVSRLGSPSVSAQYSPKKTPPRFKRNTPPLVLLHVTLLPLRWPWGDILEHAHSDDMSEGGKGLREAWRQLQDRLGDTVCERGILLPHPQSDFELLEERLLETLELPQIRRARILECGHYLGPSNEMAMSEDMDSEDEYQDDDDDRRPSRRSYEQKHWCRTCQSDIRYDSLGTNKIFRVKVYASNGLIKAGAWEACWKEMERVDVEVEPIIEPEVHEELIRLDAEQNKALELHHHQEEEMAEEHHEEQEPSYLEEESTIVHDELPSSPPPEIRVISSSPPEHAEQEDQQRRQRDEERLREIYGQTPPSHAEPASSQPPESEYTHRETPASPSAEAYARREERREEQQQQKQPVKADSLPELLLEAFKVMIQDKKNVMIMVMSALVLVFAIRGGSQSASGQREMESFQSVAKRHEGPTVTITERVARETVESLSSTVEALVPTVTVTERFAMETEESLASSIEEAVACVMEASSEAQVYNCEAPTSETSAAASSEVPVPERESDSAPKSEAPGSHSESTPACVFMIDEPEAESASEVASVEEPPTEELLASESVPEAEVLLGLDSESEADCALDTNLSEEPTVEDDLEDSMVECVPEPTLEANSEPEAESVEEMPWCEEPASEETALEAPLDAEGLMAEHEVVPRWEPEPAVEESSEAEAEAAAESVDETPLCEESAAEETISEVPALEDSSVWCPPEPTVEAALEPETEASVTLPWCQQSASQQPEPEEAFVEESIVEESGVEEPAVAESVLCEPIVQEPEAHDPEVHEPEVHEPGVHEPEVHEPEVHEPEVHEPEVHEPEVHEPEVHEPEVHEPELHEPEVHEPEVHEPELHEPEVYEPIVEEAPVEAPTLKCRPAPTAEVNPALEDESSIKTPAFDESSSEETLLEEPVSEETAVEESMEFTPEPATKEDSKAKLGCEALLPEEPATEATVVAETEIKALPSEVPLCQQSASEHTLEPETKAEPEVEEEAKPACVPFPSTEAASEPLAQLEPESTHEAPLPSEANLKDETSTQIRCIPRSAEPRIEVTPEPEPETQVEDESGMETEVETATTTETEVETQFETKTETEIKTETETEYAFQTPSSDVLVAEALTSEASPSTSSSSVDPCSTRLTSAVVQSYQPRELRRQRETIVSERIVRIIETVTERIVETVTATQFHIPMETESAVDDLCEDYNEADEVEHEREL